MSGVFVEPLDVWLFRDGRPFTARADHHARSLFPPSPLTVYGALRTRRLFEAAARDGRDLADSGYVEQVVGAPDDFTRLRLRGPLLARREPSGGLTRCFPAPLDVAASELADQATPQWTLLAPRTDVPGLVTDLGLGLPWAPGPPPRSAAGSWLAEADFFATLEGRAPDAVVAAMELYQVEARSGIELGWADHRPLRTAREGRLFSVGFVRPAPGVGLWLEVAGDELPGPTGLLGLGGEAHGSRYALVLVPMPDRTAVRQRVARSGRLKLVLATPALFSGGWLPGWLDPRTRASTGAVPGLELVAAAVGRPQPIGGFDVRAQRPRPIRPAAPAGSVYWLREREPGAAVRAFDQLDGLTIADSYAEIGFGLAYGGVW